MRFLVLLSVLCLLQSPQGPNRQQGMATRGDHVMGFSHEKTSHHFVLYPDGGLIQVSANQADDQASIDQVRMHLGHIAKIFAAGNFHAPMLIHDTTPPGVASMEKLKTEIRYDFSQTDCGASIRLTTPNPEALDAIHALLLFQIIDHQTVDSPAIQALPKS